MHPSGGIAFWHLLMNDAAAGGHPLHVAGADHAAVADAVAVRDRPRQHISDGFDAAMRMPGKASKIVLRNVVAEIVKQEERIEILGVAEPERPPQMHPGAFERGLRFDDSLHWPDGHRNPQTWNERMITESILPARLTFRRIAERTCSRGLIRNIPQTARSGLWRDVALRSAQHFKADHKLPDRRRAQQRRIEVGVQMPLGVGAGVRGDRKS